jgi:hypothetical protein
MLRWCVSRKLATHAQPLPTLLLPQNLPQQLLIPKRNQRVATVVAVAIVANRQIAAATIR